jgi:hypothetical protein
MLLAAPFLDISDDFSFGHLRDEGKEFIAASDTKAMIFTSPILLALHTLYRTTEINLKIDAFKITIFAVMLVLVLVGCNKVFDSLSPRGLCPIHMVWRSDGCGDRV